MLLFNNRNKREEKAADKEKQFQHEENILTGQMPQNAEDEYYKVQSDKEKSDLIKWQQDLSEDAVNLGYDIMGYYFDDNNEKWVKEEGTKPLANIKFIRRIRPLLKLGSSRNFMMTNFSDERVRRTLQRAAMSFTNLIYFHWKTFDIDKKDCGYLVELYQQLIEPTIYRSCLNGERKYLTTINKRIETFSDRPEQKKKSLFGT